MKDDPKLFIAHVLWCCCAVIMLVITAHQQNTYFFIIAVLWYIEYIVSWTVFSSSNRGE